jgi:riboflavin kinase / FMN adenylyltransferase
VTTLRLPGSASPVPESGPQPVVITTVDALQARPRRVAIGNFDGVHLGHAAVIRGCDTVLTFDPHPLAVLRPDRCPARLTGMREKVARLGALGVVEVVVMTFDRKVAAMTPDEFVEEVLVRRLGAIEVSVGRDFRYGASAAGDLASLRTCQRFRTRSAELVRRHGAIVSSTRIRAAIAEGEVELAAELLGRPHRVTGRAIGPFRVALDGSVLAPPAGLYRCRVGGHGTPGPAATCDVRIDGGVAELEGALAERLVALPHERVLDLLTARR